MIDTYCLYVTPNDGLDRLLQRACQAHQAQQKE